MSDMDTCKVCGAAVVKGSGVCPKCGNHLGG